MNQWNKLRRLWIGREIEYRSYQSLSKNPSLYRSRIVKVLICGYAVAQVTHTSKLGVESRNVVNKLVGLEYFRKKHHKKVYLPSGFKYPWATVNENIYHIVRWSQTRWKQACVTESFRQEELEYYADRYTTSIT